MKFYTNVVKLNNELLVRGYEDGKPFKEKVVYSPTLFVNCKEKTKYKDIYGNYCLPVNHDNMIEARKWYESTKDISNVNVLGMENFTCAFISDTYFGKPYDPSLIRTAFIDIEVYHRGSFPEPKDAPGVINAITLYDSITKKYYTFGLKPWDARKSDLNQKTICDKVEIDLTKDIIENTIYKQCSSEKELLIEFLQHWKRNYPDVVTGFNSNRFDLPYLVQRIQNIVGETAMKSLSPWGRVLKRLEKDDFGKESLSVNITGIAQIDYLDSYIKFGYRPTRAFYNLDYISYIELGQQKLDYTGSHADLSDNDPQKYIDYNIKDVWLVVQLDNKLSLLSLIIGLSYTSGINFEDPFSPVKMWDAIIFNRLRKDNIVIPQAQHIENKEKFEGAFVKEPVPSFYKWIVSFDLTSMYPKLLEQYNISPETIRNKEVPEPIENYIYKRAVIKNPEYTFAANGMQYTKEFRGVIPLVAQEKFDQRVIHKDLMKAAKKKGDKKEETLQNVLQMAAKIAINSLYGILGNRYFRYYNIDNAEAVTKSGQLSIQWIQRKLNEFFNKITGIEKDRCIAIDTDSVYFCLEDIVNKHMNGWSNDKITEALDKFAKEKIQPYINKSYEELAEYTNAYENKMSMKREAIASTGFWTAKKRYALNVYDMEDYRYKPEEIAKGENLKILGLETQKSSTPVFIQEALKEAIRIILQEDNNKLFNFNNDFEKIYKAKDYKDICEITSVNHLKKYSDKNGLPIKGAQMHVKGALAHNRLARKVNIKLIEDGDKIGLMPIKTPNRFDNAPAIAFGPAGIPKEFDSDYILSIVDYNDMYNKVYIKPLKLILDAIDWKLEDSVDLTDFFV